MRVIMYSSGLGPKIPSGIKTTTIRAKARCKAGDILSHREWTGKAYRSKQRELCQSKCLETCPITIGIDGSCIIYCLLSAEEKTTISQWDGFASWSDLLDYFRKTHGLPFYGEIIRWSPESILFPKP